MWPRLTRWRVLVAELENGGNTVVIEQLWTIGVESRVKNVTPATCARVLALKKAIESRQQRFAAVNPKTPLEEPVTIRCLQAAWMPLTLAHRGPVRNCIFDDTRLAVVD